MSYELHKLEDIITEALKRHQKEMLKKCIRKYIDLIRRTESEEDFRAEINSLCRFFEAYPDGHSFLQPEYRDYARELVEQAVETGVKILKQHKNVSCLLGIIKVLERHNFNCVVEEKQIHDFPFKPVILNTYSKELISLIEEDFKELYATTIDFLTAKTPREYIINLIEKNIPFPETCDAYRDAEKVVECLNLIKPYIHENKIKDYLKKAYHVSIKSLDDLELIKQYIKISESVEGEIEKGVFVDVEGTLIINGELNKQLLEEIQQESKKGKRIVVFSDGPTQGLTKKLRDLGFPERFLPIEDKDEYRGKILEYLIDDTHPVFQGFKSMFYKMVRE